VIPGEHAPFTFTAGGLHQVIVEPAGSSWRDPVREDRAARATQ
jgi:hypothetical protein